MEYAVAQIRPLFEWRWPDALGRLLIGLLLYLGIVYNPGEGLYAAAWWLAICLGCAALSWLHKYRILGFLCVYMILPVFAGTGFGLLRALGLAP